MKDFRCKKCDKLLGRFRECKELEIKCPRCNFVNHYYDVTTVRIDRKTVLAKI